MPDHAPRRLLDDVPEGDRRRLLTAARRRTFGRGEVVFHESDPADALHLVIRGRFAVRIVTPLGDTVTLALRGPGESFGELAVVSDDPHRSATVESLDAGETRAIRKPELDALRREHPHVTDVLIALLADEIRATNARLVEAITVDARRRLLRRLLDLAAGTGDASLRITQVELASLAGTSRATANRVLRAEERRGTLTLTRGRIELLDRARLERRAR